MLGIKCLPRSGDLYDWYKPKLRVNVAEGAYGVILNWGFEVFGGNNRWMITSVTWIRVTEMFRRREVVLVEFRAGEMR